MIRKLLPIIVALVAATGITLVATSQQDGTVTQADGPSVLQIIAASAALAGQMPPPGQCVAAEVALAVNDDPDASGAVQRTYELCSLSTDAGADALDKLAKQCKQAAQSLCDLYDAGDEDKAIDRCEREARDACQTAARSAAYVGWVSSPYPVTSQTKPVARMTRKAASQVGCVCADSHDAGPCRYWPQGADAQVRAPTATVVPNALATGRGCVPAPCVETAARKFPGSEIPPECLP